MPTVTRGAIRRDAARLLGSLLWSGTASGGTAITLVDVGDQGLRDGGMAASYFAGAWVLLTSGADSGQWRQITPSGYAPTTGILTVGGAWPTGPSSGVTYEIYTTFDPTQWNTIIDDALARLRFRTRTPLTLCTDGDMETSADANWTESSATDAKLTTGAFVFGTQALTVTNTGANGYVQSDNIPCNPSDSFTVWADYQATAGTARLRLWDVTNSSSIAVDTGTDAGLNNEGGMIMVSGTTNATTRNVAVRLIGDEATAIINWDNVIVMRSGRRRYPIPTWITERDQIVDFLQRHGNRPNEYQYTSVQPPVDVEDDWSAVNTFVVVLSSGSPHPIYIEAMRPYSALATDATTTTCPLEFAKYAVAWEAYLRLSPDVEVMVNQRAHAIKKAEIARRLTELTRRHMSARPTSSATHREWIASA